MNEEPECPWCGHKHRDHFEWSDSEIMECEECEKEFKAERNTWVTWDTEKVTKKETK